MTNLIHMTLKCTFRKENFLRKKMKNLRVDNFLQLFVQALQNKLLALPKKDNKKLPYVENYLTEVRV